MKKMRSFYVSLKHIAWPIKIQHEMPYTQVSFTLNSFFPPFLPKQKWSMPYSDWYTLLL